jgi:hypothetical protein
LALLYVFAETERLESPNSSHLNAELKCGGNDTQLPPMKRNVASGVITVTL